MHYQPADSHTVNPYSTVDDPRAALDFYTRAFAAEVTLVLPMGDQIMHAEFKIGDSAVMLSGEWPDRGILSPKSRGGPTSSLAVYVPDVDAAFAKAVAEGAAAESHPTDEFWGDRTGTVVDPFGHRWSLLTHIEDVSPDEMKARMARMGEAMAEGHPS